MDDILVKYGVLKDDNFKIIKSHDGSTVEIDRAKPRTEIEILKIATFKKRKNAPMGFEKIERELLNG